MDFVTALIIAAVAFVAGVLSGKIITPSARRIKELEAEIEKHTQTHQTYKNEVAEHFSKSASLFGDITEKYRSLYEHMSTSAYDLCDRRSIPRELSTSHVNILAVESPEISANLTDHGVPVSSNSTTDEFIVDVSRSGLSPLDTESQLMVNKNKKGSDKTAEIINLDSQRGEDTPPAQQAKDYAIKAKGVINHNSLDRDDVST